MTNSDLREIAAQIMRMEDAKQELADDIKAAKEAAKSKGYNAKALAQAIKIARMDSTKRAAHEQTQMDLELYLEQIEGKRLEAVA